MANADIYIGQRRSYAGALCTVRYHGPLSKTKGEWLGVEWDDPSRGKHNGQHEGQQMFQCVSPSSTAASFVRPSRKPDPERTLLEAIKFKYAPANASGVNSSASRADDGAIEISGKIVEEVGFERIQKQLSVLADLKIVLVDELAIWGVAAPGASRDDIRHAQIELARTCPNILELDLGWNTIETWQDVVDMCVPFKKLKILKASGLRLRSIDARFDEEEGLPFRNVEELQMTECLLTSGQIVKILCPGQRCVFPNLKTLSLSSNELDSFEDGRTQDPISPSVTTLILDNNRFQNLAVLPALFALFPNITALSFQGNAISHLGLETLRSGSSTQSLCFSKLETANVTGNKISDYSFIDAFPSLFPNLTSLRISRNPLYERSQLQDPSTTQVSEPRRQQKVQSTTSDSTSYYLTLARIPGLKSLNYTTITARDREEGEIYYLSMAEKELKIFLDTEADKSHKELSPEERVALSRQKHPLYTHLCEKYDREDILQRYLQAATSPLTESPGSKSHLDTYAAGTLGSRLVDAYFYIPSTNDHHRDSSLSSTPFPPWTEVLSLTFHRPLPTTLSVYRLKSLLSRHFGLPALQFRLIYESHEYDPVEPISSSRNTGADGEEKWAGWGDWDVDVDVDVNDQESPLKNAPMLHGDHDHGTEHEHEHEDGREENETSTPTTTPPATVALAPMYILREGQRFKKRETEILDGMRPWGDFLDLELDASSHIQGVDGQRSTRHWGRKTRVVQVRVRVECLRWQPF